MFLLRISFQKRRGIEGIALSLGHHIGVQKGRPAGRRRNRRAQKQMPGIYRPGIADSVAGSFAK
jgi:hypothetical protein